MQYQQNGVFATILAPVTAATTARSGNLDTADANFATILVNVGAEANTNATGVAISFSESNETDASTFATFNSTFNRTVDNTAATCAVTHIDLRGRKRYIRVTITPDTTANGAVIADATGVLYQNVQTASVADRGESVVVG